MDAKALIGPLVLASSAVPVLIAAVLVGRGRLRLLNGLDASRLRDPAAAAAKFARLLALLAMAMALGGAGLYWAGDHQGRIAAVVVALLVAVNGLAVAMILGVAAARRGYRAPDQADAARGRPRTPRQ